MENQPAQEYHVTYFDPDCGRILSDTFESLNDAERLASRHCVGEESWAVIDAVSVGQARIAA